MTIVAFVPHHRYKATMCGIIGIVGNTLVATPLLDALKRLEYRGYDSAGIATIHKNAIHQARAAGKLENLDAELTRNPIEGSIGIGHTRWATHGMPTLTNAHPHATDKVAVVHNGIIENYQAIRDELSTHNYAFHTETDTEVIPQLITYFLEQGATPHGAVKQCLAKLEGAFALGIIFRDHPELLIAARRGSPLAVGYGENSMYLGSDAIALAPLTNKICYLQEGDWAELTPSSVKIFDEQNNAVERSIKTTAIASDTIGKGDYAHFMYKEIHEQPTVVGETYNVYFNPSAGRIILPELSFALDSIKHITIVACGTSYYAALVARYWLESIAGVSVELDIASEFRYRTPKIANDAAFICISQSGETADTLAALRYAKTQSCPTIAIVNVTESSMALEADAILPTHAGPEIGVASTKAFTTQLTTLACFALALAESKNAIEKEEYTRLCHALGEVASSISEILHHDDHLLDIAKNIQHVRDMLYIGRGTSFAIAHEGALKMKEISYIHAEAYAAGEMKHGPIALVDEDVPVIALIPNDHLHEKTLSNVAEAAARGGHIISISDTTTHARLKDTAKDGFIMPSIDPFVAPILYAIPMQLLAYHVAVLKGTDVDQPRNLAKSVTVE